MRKFKIVDRDGKVVDEDVDRPLRDGETLRVASVLFMDSMLVPQASAYEKALTEAWRNPPPVLDTSVVMPLPASSINDAYARYDATIEQRWRGAR